MLVTVAHAWLSAEVMPVHVQLQGMLMASRWLSPAVT